MLFGVYSYCFLLLLVFHILVSCKNTGANKQLWSHPIKPSVNLTVFSLGISILELASDLDLPRGGLLWHSLRSGQLPEDFLKGRSCELKRTIAWMMEPDPFKRPTVDEVLESQTVRTVSLRSQEYLDDL